MAKFKIVPNRRGVREIMKGAEMNDFLKSVARDMTDGDDRYDIQAPWDARVSRRVVNVRDLNDDAIGHEIQTGTLARMLVTRISNGGS